MGSRGVLPLGRHELVDRLPCSPAERAPHHALGDGARPALDGVEVAQGAGEPVEERAQRHDANTSTPSGTTSLTVPSSATV